MKTIVQILAGVLILLYLSGCVTKRREAEVRADDRKIVEQELGTEMSLREDRDSLKDYRREVPEDTQKQNDELALFLNLMRQGNENPQMVRDRFNVMVQKKRATFRDKAAKLREIYRDEETKRREKHLEQAKIKRERYLRRKLDAKDNREFFNELEKERLTFSATERARRTSFEAEVGAQSKDFDAYMREKQKEFDEQYRLYTKKFSERPKDKKAATGDEFKRLEQAPATSLGTED